MLSEVLIHFGGAGRLANSYIFLLGVTISAGLGIPRKAAGQVLFHCGLTFGCHPQRKELSGGRRGARFEDMDALAKIQRIRIGKDKTDWRALLDHAQRGIIIDAAIKSVFAGCHFLQTFSLPAYQNHFVLNDSSQPFQMGLPSFFVVL